MDVLTVEQRRKNMKAIKSKGTRIEKMLGKALWTKGYRYRKNDKDVFGRPDFTFKKYKVAIFCDSEYFHGKDWKTQKHKIKTNTEFWHRKIEKNIDRDKLVNETLLKNGWQVIRFWEKDIINNLDLCVFKIEKFVENKVMIYSELKKKINIEPLLDQKNEMAFATHYLHNSGNSAARYFEEPAITYLTKFNMNRQEKLNFNWDIPFPPVKNPKFTFIDLFAGIGGIRLAFQEAGGKCLFSSEYNKFSKVTYEANFGEVPFGDITLIDEKSIPEHDILLAGFPCQPFSIAGVSKKNSLGRNHGFLDKTQGTLFFDIARILQEKRPKSFMLENVKNLISHDKGKTFEVIYNVLNDLGYSIHFKILNGKLYVPQNRERILIVGFDRRVFNGNEFFNFPESPEQNRSMHEILEDNPDSKYTLSDKLWTYLIDYAAKHKAKGNGFGYGLTDIDGISRTLSARYYKDGSEILIPQKNMNPRRLTPRECARLQGFPDKFIIPVSDNQAYRQFGNSVVVPLISAVAKQIILVLENFNE